ncbi:MAG: iron-sulfur cluster assembly accessory protein [Verrucomicrobium sp.]|nr:iron-sulfur cluster assembly accessory protein [Verrucomicrobium sp.]
MSAPEVLLTEAAAAQIRERVGADAAKGLRLFVTGGGCSGMQYEMALASKEPGDKEFDQHGTKLFVDEKSLLWLEGSTIDYQGGLSGAGFRIQNPNAKATCGCGTSFSA